MVDKSLKKVEFLEETPKGELYFKGPYSKSTIKYFTLINLSDKKVCFKINTNAPDLFCIWPDNGNIFCKCSIKIMILLKSLSQFIDQRKFIREHKNKTVIFIQTFFYSNKKKSLENSFYYNNSFDINQSFFKQHKMWKIVDPKFIKESILNCKFELPSFIYRTDRSIKAKQVLEITFDNQIKKISFMGSNFIANAKFLFLKNPSNDRICFKIKTLSPFNFSIKPSDGIIDVKSFTKVIIISPPFNQSFENEEKYIKINCNFKFLIQAILAPDDEEPDNSFWYQVDSSDIMESILECVFELSFEKNQKSKNSMLSLYNSSLENKNVDEDLYDCLNIIKKY